jgi:hypothetical protein
MAPEPPPTSPSLVVHFAKRRFQRAQRPCQRLIDELSKADRIDKERWSRAVSHWKVLRGRVQQKAIAYQDQGLSNPEMSELARTLDALDDEWRAVCEVWEEPVAGKQAKRGRPPRSGLEEQDRPLLEKMKSLLSTERAVSIPDAARQVAREATGYGTTESKQKRLERRYRHRLASGE